MFSDPQFWVAISFLLFILAIFNPVKKMLVANLDSQIKEIREKIEEAEDIRKEAEKVLNEVKEREVNVEDEINKLKLSSNKRINELKNLSSTKLDEQINKRKFLAETKIEQITRDANLTIKNYIADSVIEVTTSVLKNNLSDNKKTVLVDESIAEMKNLLKN